ncbi:MAG: PBSX family phage terminase large subunit [Oscillospiraceae bacterium]
MRFESISKKQAEIFKFMAEPYYALICDGSVRSGKTTMMVIAFIEWAMAKFSNCNFAICGKTVRSAERNIIAPTQSIASMRKKYTMVYTRSVSLLTVTKGNKTNNFYVFGGKDEASYMLIQGITLHGVLFDEVALMPRSFVEQAITRTLSVDSAKLWFNCNPESPQHWFYKEWIQEAEKHNAKHIHFLMEDNPGNSAKAMEKAKTNFVGVFYQRYILGLWVVAEGLIYTAFSPENITSEIPEDGQYYISVDYGTLNPFSAGLWCVADKKATRIKEFYYSGRDRQAQKTDEEYYAELDKLASYIDEDGDKAYYPIQSIVIDPSAASFIACIRRHGQFNVTPAVNDVLNGIRYVSSLLNNQKIMIHESCKDAIEEFGQYSWDEKSNEDRPVKQSDHAMDDIRYFANTILRRVFRWDIWG